MGVICILRTQQCAKHNKEASVVIEAFECETANERGGTNSCLLDSFL